MQSKLTPELSKALDRAIDAAASDPLVEALSILRELIDDADIGGIVDRAEEDAYHAEKYAENEEEENNAGVAMTKCQHALRLIQKARKLLAKYRPALSDSDTMKS